MIQIGKLGPDSDTFGPGGGGGGGGGNSKQKLSYKESPEKAEPSVDCQECCCHFLCVRGNVNLPWRHDN